MGKSLPLTTTKLQEFAKVISSSSGRLQRVPKHTKPIPRSRVSAPKSVKPSGLRVNSELVKLNVELQDRFPLSHVFSDCEKQWFEDALKEKAGDFAMQVLVGQMYCSGYGVPRDAKKGHMWIARASKSRASVWKVSNKHPGYNASDLESDELRG
ncbi:LOW QUALITY PROTEIN: hypothetical protein CFOL_v3_05980 [Cephalotus follicularis]|uniref:Sel1 domain-containing protein n=1 Tax=Cephalotus follicularis TaxID=3775 RepID=A0A1Q3B381_CEPFO|nr:LOW QUALITY PROTEIN: hypothetical protein CFOL_v3_05980 [Cephalotus follicularis]